MNLITNSLAIFSLFFGAGNAVFPILLGLTEKENLLAAFIGLSISAIVLPCLGLMTVFIYQGSLKKFYAPLGKIPRESLVALMAGLLGPLAVMPRCVIVAHASIQGLGSNIPLALFSFGFCAIAFAFLWTESRTFSFLGKVLSPILVLSLITIIVFSSHKLSFVWSTASFTKGFLVGYKTLDLVAALFFAPSLFHLLKGKSTLSSLLYSSLLAFCLLTLIYLGLASAASQNGLLQGSPETLLPELAKSSLGKNGAYIACISVALACLTTVVGLSLSLNDWLIKSNSRRKHRICSFLSLSICSLFTLLGFETIMIVLEKILFIFYPFLIIWCFYKLYLKTKNYLQS